MKCIKNTFLFFVLLLFTVNNSSAQEVIDSAKVYYAMSKEKSKSLEFKVNAISKSISLLGKDTTNHFYLKTLNRKSYLLNQTKSYDSALVFSKKLLKRSLEQKSLKMEKLALEKLADYNRLNQDLIGAYKYYEAYKEFNLKYKDTLAVIKALQYIASSQNKIGLPFESEATAVECLMLLDKIKETPKVVGSKIGLYNHLGILYKDLKNYDRALMLYEKALLLTKNTKNRNKVLNNKAVVFIEQDKLKEAEQTLELVYKNTLSQNLSSQKAQALDNLGFVQSKLNKPVGLKNLKKALQLKEKENNSSSLFTSHIHLAKYYLDKNNFEKAKIHSEQAYKLANISKSVSDRIEALAILGKSTSHSKITEYIYLKDSLQEVRLLNTAKYTSIKYDYVKQTLLAKESELEKEKEKRLKFIYMALGSFIFLASVFMYFILKAKNKKTNLQNIFTTEARISKKVHDEVANDVYHVMAKLQGNKTSNEVVLDDLEAIYIKTRDISRENNAVGVTENFDDVLADLLQSYISDTTNVITRNLSKIEWQAISELKKMTIYRVLQELMVNMKKHSEASFVVVNFEMVNNKLVIIYKDNGVGTTLNKANGLQNVENRINGIKGTITFDTEVNNGFKAEIKV